MIINGIDVRRYGATLLTAETKPPKMTANYEMMPKALLRQSMTQIFHWVL